MTATCKKGSQRRHSEAHLHRRSYMSLHGKYTTHSQHMHRRTPSFESRSWHLFTTNEMQVQMFFGRDIPDGGYVTDKDWESFEELLNQRLRDGFTILDGVGMWHGSREKTKLVSTSVKDESIIDNIIQIYKSAFKQDSVAVQYLPPLVFK